eukprot:scaffold10.g2460.t1
MGHHLQRHYLTPEQAAGALKHFGTGDSKVAARHIARMSQADLRQAFVAVYGSETHSNNNAWLRRKLLDAVGASRRLCNRAHAAKPRRRPAAPAPAPVPRRAPPPPALAPSMGQNFGREAGAGHGCDAGSSYGAPQRCSGLPARPLSPFAGRVLYAGISSGSSNSLSGNSLSGPGSPPAPAALGPAPLDCMDGLLVNTHTMESALQEESLEALPPCLSPQAHSAQPGTPNAPGHDPMRLVRTPSDLSSWDVAPAPGGADADAADAPPASFGSAFCPPAGYAAASPAAAEQRHALGGLQAALREQLGLAEPLARPAAPPPTVPCGLLQPPLAYAPPPVRYYTVSLPAAPAPQLQPAPALAPDMLETQPSESWRDWLL